MAKKKRGVNARSETVTSTAVGDWLITCEGDTRKHRWAQGLPVGAEFKITLDDYGKLYFEPGHGCGGVFKGRRKLLTTVKSRASSRAFHDGDEVTEHSFRLRMKAGRSTFQLSGFRHTANRTLGTDEGAITIHTVSRSLDQSMTRIRRPAIFNITHGGPHGEPKQKATATATTVASHKLIGRWKIVDQGRVAEYPWASGLPKGARFEITDALDFVPGDGCKDLFGNRGKAERWSGRLPLRHEGEHQHTPLLDDETLRLTLTDGTVITLNGSRQPKPGKRKGRVSISGPRVGIAGFILNHGGPHGEPD